MGSWRRPEEPGRADGRLAGVAEAIRASDPAAERALAAGLGEVAALRALLVRESGRSLFEPERFKALGDREGDPGRILRP